jgi:hypothetical protein
MTDLLGQFGAIIFQKHEIYMFLVSTYDYHFGRSECIALGIVQRLLFLFVHVSCKAL